MKKLDTRLIRSIKKSKGQFISISLMIILALTIYVSFSMVADNLYNSIYHYYEITNFGDIFIDLTRIPKSAIDKLSSIEGVEMAQGRISLDVPLRVEDPKEKVTVRVVSLSSEDDPVNDLYIIDGETLGDSSQTTLVLQQFFDGRKMSLGEIIKPYIGGKEYSLELRGVVGSPEYIYLMENEQSLLPNNERFGVIYVTEEFAQSSFGYQGSFNQVLIKVNPAYLDKIDSIADEIEDELHRYGVRRLIKRENHLSHSVMMQEVESLETMSGAITFIFLMVAAIIINIMLSRIVKKDRISIGVMKALGYTNSKVLEHYTKYSLMIGLIGSSLGIIFSIPLAKLFTDLFIVYMNIPVFHMKIYYRYFIYGILLTSVFCIASGLFGARSVLKISPADSMRPETPKSGKRIWLEKAKWIWNRISFSWKMVIRNISRTKRRALFLIIGIALTYAITMVPFFMSNVWDGLFFVQFGEFQTMDYSIDFDLPMNKNSIKEINHLAEIDHIEPKAELPFEISHGWKKESVSIIALETNTKLYNFKTTSGNNINLPDSGILLSQILARQLGVQVGDEVIVKNFLPDKKDKHIIVKGIIEQYLGSNAYMSLDEMYNVIGDKDLITGALVKSQDDLVSKLKDVKNIRQIQSVNDMQSSLLEYMDMIIASVGVMLIFGGVLGFAIVYNITTVSINERLMEFSSLRVMGFEKSQIYRLITRENWIMTGVGIILGMPLGYGMCIALVEAVSTEIYSIPAIIDLKTYLYSTIATIIFVTIAQLATVRKIHNLQFMDALKNRLS